MDSVWTLETFVRYHRPQLESSNVPEIFWESLWRKLTNEIFDAGLAFRSAIVDYGDGERGPKDPVRKLFVVAENGTSPNEPNDIYLIDHAWRYDAADARRHLSQVPGLLERMCDLMGFVDEGGADDTDKLEFVSAEMWRYDQAFAPSGGAVEDRTPLRYIMDETGSAINHSDEPNFRTTPFLHLAEGATYTLLFPVRNAKNGDEVTRDFVEGLTDDDNTRRALLLPWLDEDFSEQDFLQTEPSEDYFLAGRVRETLPSTDEAGSSEGTAGARLKVYSEYKYVNEFLTHPSFVIVEKTEEADVLWLMDHFKDYESLSSRSPRVFVNQFPFENVLTVKDLLAIVCRRKAIGGEKRDLDALENDPPWLPTTYNLNTELRRFVAHFRQREIRGLDNHWICKPWNLARGLDTHVTNDLNRILRLPATGPKIAQKYVESPVLYARPGIGRVKFDVRYVLLLRSVRPTVAYVYSNFFLRFANKEFALNNLDDYEQHFTVMNYAEKAGFCHVKCDEFVAEWSKMYPDFDWKRDVESKIFDALRDVLEAAVEAEPPRGIAASPQSRALYAVDLMLRWKGREIQPVLLEINFSPDNKRACEYYPQFYNDVFKCLFLDETDPELFHDLRVRG